MACTLWQHREAYGFLLGLSTLWEVAIYNSTRHGVKRRHDVGIAIRVAGGKVCPRGQQPRLDVRPRGVDNADEGPACAALARAAVLKCQGRSDRGVHRVLWFLAA